MIKIKDEISGGVFPEGRIRKPTPGPRAPGAGRRGLPPDSRPGRGGARLDLLDAPAWHAPDGTVRIGQMWTPTCDQVKNLYVCDASVFPEALDRPTVLTIVGLGKRLARHLAPDTRVPRDPPSDLRELVARLDAHPRVVLGETPTLLQRLPRLSAELGRPVLSSATTSSAPHSAGTRRASSST